MAFFDEPGKTTATKVKTTTSGKKSFFEMPDEQDLNIYNKSVEASQAKDTATATGGIKGILSNAWTGIKEKFTNAAPTYDKSIENLNPLSMAENPNSFLNVASQSQKNTFNDSVQRNTNLMNVSNNPNSTLLDKGTALASSALGEINNAFSVVTAPLAGLQTIPGVGHVIDQVNRAFGMLGEGGAIVAGTAVDHLPVSAQTKEKLRPVMEEIGALAGQLLAGKAGSDVAGALHGKLTRQAQEVVNVVQNEVVQNHINKPGKPVAQAPAEQPAAVTPLVTEVKETPTPGVLTPIEGTGETKVLGGSRSITESAIKDGLNVATDELPTYKVLENETQAKLATDFIESNPEWAREVSMGTKLPPPGILPEAIQLGMEHKATMNLDVDFIMNEVKSGLNVEQKTMGQRIQFLSNRNPESPVAAIKEVISTRQKNAIKSVKGGNIKKAQDNTIREIKTHITRVAEEKQTWGQFIDSLEC